MGYVLTNKSDFRTQRNTWYSQRALHTCGRVLCLHHRASSFIASLVLCHVSNRIRSPSPLPLSTARPEGSVLGGDVADGLCECFSDAIDPNTGTCGESTLPGMAYKSGRRYIHRTTVCGFCPRVRVTHHSDKNVNTCIVYVNDHECSGRSIISNAHTD